MQTLQDRDIEFVWHPYTSLGSSPAPVPIVKGDGACLIDEAGRQYIDAISSWWVTLHGHAHPYIAEKIYRQALILEQVIFAGFTHEPAVQLAERLIHLLPGRLSKIFYSDNGSTATEVAIKMGLQYWWNKSRKLQEPANTGTSQNDTPIRTKILAFKNSYHGDTFGAMSVSDRSVFTLAFQDKLFDVIFLDTPTQQKIVQIKDNIYTHGNDVAAFIYEPLLQGAGGMRMYEAALLDEILMACKETDIICIADEVMTGFGRTGKLFASENMRIKPDIICLSKGLTGGTMALGVTACAHKIVDAFVSEDRMKTFFHGHSFTANPIACSAALASLDLLQENTCAANIEYISQQNKLFVTALNNYANIKNARSLGTIMAFEYDSGSDGYLNTVSRNVTAFMMAHGVFIRPLGNTVYIMPPYCINPEQLKHVYNTIENFLTRHSVEEFV